MAQSYIDYANLHVNNSAGLPQGLTLMIGNQAIPSFSPGPDAAVDNIGIETPGAEGWTQVIQEISIWKGNIQSVDSLRASP